MHSCHSNFYKPYLLKLKMDIKKLDLSFAMNPTVSRPDLDAILSRLAEYAETDPILKDSNPVKKSFSATQDSWVEHQKRFLCFRTAYDPSIPLRPCLIDSEIQLLSVAGGFLHIDFQTNVSLDGFDQIPNTFGYFSVIAGFREGKTPECRYTAKIKFFGNPEPLEKRELREMCDRLALPIRAQRYFLTTYRGRDLGGGQLPLVVLERDFVGDFDSAAEDNIASFYGSVKEFVLGTGITRNCRYFRIGKTLAQSESEAGKDLTKQIEDSTARRNQGYGPRLEICVCQLADNINPDGSERINFNGRSRSYREFVTLDTVFAA